MTQLGDFIRYNNSQQELNRFVNLMNYAKKFGVVLVADCRKASVTMKPCNAFLKNMFTNAGIQVSVHGSNRSPLTNKLVVIFANVWALYRNTWARRSGPIIALQSEHLGYRLGNMPYYKQFLKSCNQVWDFGFRRFPGTNTLFFPHMFYSSNFWNRSIQTSCTLDIAMAGKRDPKRATVFNAFKKRSFFNDLQPGDTIRRLRDAHVTPMIPRQNGNFEIHRFASLIAAGSCVVCVEPSPENRKLQELFSEAVIFVPFHNMVPTIQQLLQNPERIAAQKQKALDWFLSQQVEHLLKEVYDGLTTVAKGEEKEEEEKTNSPEHSLPRTSSTALPPPESAALSETQSVKLSETNPFVPKSPRLPDA